MKIMNTCQTKKNNTKEQSFNPKLPDAKLIAMR